MPVIVAARPPNLDSIPPRSLLILKPSSFGDIIHTLPAVARLKAAWPATRLSWLVNPEWAPLLAENADVDEVICFPRHQFRGWGGIPRFLKWQRQMVRGPRSDLVLDFQGLLRSALIGRLNESGRFYGMADSREGARWFYHRIAPVPEGVPHSVERYLAFGDFVMQEYEGQKRLTDTTSLRFPLPSGEPLIEQDSERLADKFVLLHPFARGTGKSLSIEQVAELCRRLFPLQVVLIGRKSGRSGGMPEAALDLLNKTTLHQLIWTIRRAACVISVDSGPAHLAAALDRPVVAIHTWSDPRRVGPYRADAWVFKGGKLLQMRALSTLDNALFNAPPQDLTTPQIGSISSLAISLSGSCA